jgi:hypothetical protein
VRGERWVLGAQAWTARRRENNMATATRLGQAGLQGGREKVADGIAEPVARRAPLDSEQVRALLGAIFFALSVLYVVKRIAATTRETRQS